ncbi:MAG: DNA-binding ATP-dependent protease La [Firmicutes bacterium ADurb.Bin419]|mgnify:CR=1 FL=1|nr:MAG: DNA-binding ATP-dependent protease La [Firmicutes bacterium ADurb.Bin419]
MHIYALFDNGTAEEIIIKLLNVEVKETLDIYFQSFRSPKVKESAKRGIESAYEAIFSKDINAYLQKEPISVTVKGFVQQVDGSSAGIAYAITFASALVKDNIIDANVNFPDIVAATGEVDISGNIKEIKNIREKILGAISQNANIMFYPCENSEELKLLLQKDEELDHAVKDSGIKLKAVDSILQLFFEIGVLPKSLLDKTCSVDHTEIC